jgi:hypothetical protein
MIKDFGTRAELEGSGIIGWTKFLIGKAPVVMPSQIYWNALKTWNILRPQEAFDRAPDRNELHAQWEQLVPHPTSVRHSDGPALQSEPDLFDDVPEAPRDWTHNNHSLRLKLTKKEAKAIRSRWNTIGSRSMRKKDAHYLLFLRIQVCLSSSLNSGIRKLRQLQIPMIGPPSKGLVRPLRWSASDVHYMPQWLKN